VDKVAFGRLCRVTQQLSSGYVTQNPLGTKPASSHFLATALLAAAQLVLTLTHPGSYSQTLLCLPFCGTKVVLSLARALPFQLL